MKKKPSMITATKSFCIISSSMSWFKTGATNLDLSVLLIDPSKWHNDKGTEVKGYCKTVFIYNFF